MFYEGRFSCRGGNLAQISNQMEEEDSMGEFNPWNRGVQLLERMLEIQDSMQIKITMKENKDEREVVRISKKRVTNRIRLLQGEEQQFEELVDRSFNLKQK